MERRITKETAGELIKNAGVIGLEFKTNPHRTIATLQDGGRVVTVYEHSLSAFTTRDNIHVSYFLLSKVEKEVDDLYYQTLNRSMNRQELNRVIIGRTLKCVRAGFGVLELSTDNQNRVIIESDGGLFYTVVDKDGVARPVDFVGTHETGLTVK